jgi:sugar lactone lactonase YvrE
LISIFSRPTYVEPLYIIDNDGLGLQGASGLAVDSHDRIFISDTGHHRIVICTPEGSYITHFGIEGDGPGELKRPCGLDITNDGTIVVADSGNKRLQLFGSIREQTMEDDTDDKNILLIDSEVPAK